jgi:hypothetical protein
MEHRTSEVRAMRNEATCLCDVAVVCRRRLFPREAFLIAYERLALLAEVAREPSIAVVAVAPEARVVDAQLLGDRRALIIGRHSQCALRLDETSVALRHAAALARFEDGKPILHLWDLHTGMPFVTEDFEPSGAIVAGGPCYVSIGPYALWFVPVGYGGGFSPRGAGASAQAAWLALPERSFVDRRAPLLGKRSIPRGRAPGHAGSPLAPLDDRITWVTHVAAPLLLGEGAEPEIGWGTIRLSGPAQRERRAVSAERLEQGVLLGRYERCGMTVGGADGVSRVHLLLVRIGAEVWAIDTASSNGVRRDGQVFSAGVLEDSDHLVLAGAIEVGWQRRAMPEA